MPVCFYVVEGHPSENATKIWLLKNDTFTVKQNLPGSQKNADYPYHTFKP